MIIISLRNTVEIDWFILDVPHKSDSPNFQLKMNKTNGTQVLRKAATRHKRRKNNYTWRQQQLVRFHLITRHMVLNYLMKTKESFAIAHSVTANSDYR